MECFKNIDIYIATKYLEKDSFYENDGIVLLINPVMMADDMSCNIRKPRY